MTGPTVSEAGLLTTGEGQIEYLVEHADGSGTTIVGHGFTKTIPDTRRFVAGAPGTTVYLHFRGHGQTMVRPELPWSIAGLADEFRTVADRFEATRAVVVSFAAKVLATVMSEDEGRFDRAVFILPSPVFAQPESDDGPLTRMRSIILAADVEAVTQGIIEGQPTWMNTTDPRGVLAHAMAAELIRQAPVVGALADLERSNEGIDRVALSGSSARVLVLGQHDDRVHDFRYAEELASTFRFGELCELGEQRSLSGYCRRIRSLVTDFLGG
ncbi:alpha-beta hydrolase superfamily lysophospholipase [Jatrophihabitans sp. GAS493]|uniref:alpha/beta fold hydrolase n=1 Tax=Jatrophihabitans sp. GAS493 TaxID=1907575 RepID=UPI000BB77DE8|nr:alpha/beta hydrolase [Jatrophihabitans sp. GAS493]SOD75060.1 alpha-beta hydrolase superfamily lysophospholipase [Jatrophihabitans sp. GAS493]